MCDKLKCLKCNNVATWLYMPNGNAYCDDCVPRGCSCNVYSIKEFPLNGKDERNYIFWNADITQHTDKETDGSFYYEPIDEKGRRYPCCEYWYDENGFEKEDY